MLTINGYCPTKQEFFSVDVSPEIAAMYPQTSLYVWFPQQVLDGVLFDAIALMIGEGLVSPDGHRPIEVDGWNEELALKSDRPTWGMVKDDR